MARLGDICEILDSKRIPITASNRKAGIYPYYGANGIQDYVDDYIFDDELVLLAEDGGHFGSTDKPIAYRVSGKCWVNNHAHVLKPKAILDVDYLCYSLMFRDVSNIVNGATRQKLTQADMREIEIPLLTLGEQLAIVEKLNKIFALISLRKQQLSKLDELVKSRFVELFGEPMENPHNYPVKRIDEVAELVKGITYSPEEVCDKDGIVVLRSSNIKGSTFDLQDIVIISKKVSSEKLVKENDILMCNRNGSARLVGKVALIPKLYEDMTFGTFMTIVRSQMYKYLFVFFQMEAFRRQIQFQTAVAINQISLPLLAGVTVPIPPMELQEQFAAFVEQTDKLKFEIQKSLEKLETLKKALMQKYFG